MRIFFLLFLGSALFFQAGAQAIEVWRVETIRIPGEGLFHPVFDRQNRLYVTSEDYRGLYRLDMSSQKRVPLSRKPGAGYKPLFFPDKVVINPFFHREGRRYFRISAIDLKQGGEQILSEGRFIAPLTGSSRGLLIREADRIRSPRGSLAKTGAADTLAYARDSLIVVRTAAGERLMQPLGGGHYLWVSLSPDSRHVLFRKAGRGSYVTDLAGNILAEMPGLNAPQWSPDGRFVAGMRDRDDGYRITASDIEIHEWRTGKSIAVTRGDEEIEMYPNWSPDGTKLAFHTLKGALKIAYVRQK